ncbi:MAG: VanZ family protein [Fusobacteriaceae bacterium]
MKTWKNIPMVYAIAVCIIIFYFGSQTSDNSMIQTRYIINLLRNSAHIGLYAILGFFITLCQKGFKKDTIFYSFIAVLFLAFTDEFLQSFIPGRGSELSDVFLDGVGGGIGIFLGKIFKKI